MDVNISPLPIGRTQLSDEERCWRSTKGKKFTEMTDHELIVVRRICNRGLRRLASGKLARDKSANEPMFEAMLRAVAQESKRRGGLTDAQNY